MNRQAGFTLLESLVAVAILGIVLSAILPTFLTYLDANTMSEERTGALAAAQETMEQLRQLDPATLPNSGSSPLQVVSVGQRDFEVMTHFCTANQFCGDDRRHLLVEVSYGGRTVYSVESVFTTLN
jgi:prepilin-type N-terminal cleavage/methylation domain-containing protein